MSINPALANYLHMFATAPGTRKVPQDQVIFNEGDPGDAMYVVLDGAVRIESNGKVLSRLHSADIFGEMALVDDSLRSASAIADTDCTLAAVDQERFEEMIRETPYFYKYLLHLLAERLRAKDHPRPQ